MNKKLLSILPLGLGSIALPLVLTSCSENYTVTKEDFSSFSEEDQDVYKFIADRTFSIYGGSNSGGGCLGTAWYITDKNGSHYFATNEHVYIGMVCAGTHVWLAHDNNLFKNDNKTSSIIQISNSNYTEVTSHFNWLSQPNSNGFHGDLWYFTINGSTYVDNILTNVAPLTSDDFVTIDPSVKQYTNFYVAGYPVSGSYTAFNSNAFTLANVYNDDHDTGYSEVNCNMYLFNKGITPYRLKPGSSGSMCVVKNPSSSEHPYLVAGIYWGYMYESNTNDASLYGSVDIIKTTSYDLTFPLF